MNTINLSKYVQSFMFLRNMEEKFPYDGIVYLGENVGVAVDFPVPVEFFPESGPRVMEKIMKYSKPLIVSDQFPISFFGDDLKKIDATIVNLFTGISSLGYKMGTEISDVNYVMERGFSVCEPYDLGSFLALLDGEKKRYIRLVGSELSAKLLHDEEKKVTETKLLSMDCFGVGGDQATLLCSGNYLGTLLQSVQILNQEELFFDLFALLDYGAEFDDSMKKSLMRTGRLFVFLDQLKDSSVEKIILDKVVKLGKYELKFFYPSYKKVTSFADEFRGDQAGFDQVGLAEKIMSIK